MNLQLTDFIDELESLKEYLSNPIVDIKEAKARIAIVIKDMKRKAKQL